MYRIDSVNALPNGNGSGKSAFTAGNPTVPTGATVLHPDWLNEVQEETSGLIESMGVPLVKGVRTQLQRAIGGPLAFLRKNFLRNWGRASYPVALGRMVWVPSMGKAVSVAGTSAAVSADGVSWIGASSNPAVTINDVAYGAGLFVGVGSTVTANQISTSPDGLTWTTATGPAGGGFWNAIAYSPTLGLFVIMGYNGGTTKFATSPNGTTWTLQSPSVGSFLWDDVEWCDTLGLFVLSGVGGSYRAATSPDGITWTQRVTPTMLLGSSRVVWAKEIGRVVIFDTNYANANCLVSSDGINWIVSAMSATGPNAIKAAAWCPELGGFVAVTAGSVSTGTRVYFSADGTSWSFVTVLGMYNTIPTDLMWIPDLGRLVLSATGSGTASMFTLFGDTPDLTEKQATAASGSIGSWTTGAVKNVLSISGLAPGTYEVDAAVAFSAAAITGTQMVTTVRSDNGTAIGPSDQSQGATAETPQMPTASSGVTQTLRTRVTLTASTNTIFLNTRLTFSAGTPTAGAFMVARPVTQR